MYPFAFFKITVHRFCSKIFHRSQFVIISMCTCLSLLTSFALSITTLVSNTCKEGLRSPWMLQCFFLKQNHISFTIRACGCKNICNTAWECRLLPRCYAPCLAYFVGGFSVWPRLCLAGKGRWSEMCSLIRNRQGPWEHEDISEVYVSLDDRHSFKYCVLIE